MCECVFVIGTTIILAHSEKVESTVLCGCHKAVPRRCQLSVMMSSEICTVIQLCNVQNVNKR